MNRHRAPGLRDRKKHELRARLLGEARRLFVLQGYWRTTVEQIAAAADVTPATFFNYFPTKNHALNELAGDLFDALNARLAEQSGTSGSSAARLARFFGDATSVTRDAHERLGSLLLRAVRAAAGGEGGAQLERLRTSLASLLAEGQRDGSVRLELDGALAAEMALGALFAVLIRWLDDPRHPVEARLAQAATFIGAAVATPGSFHFETQETRL